VRSFIALAVGVVFLFGLNFPLAAQEQGESRNYEIGASANRPALIIERIAFVGLRRIAAPAVEAQIVSLPGTTFDPERVAHDVKKLGQLGWFEDIRVEAKSAPESFTSGLPTSPRLVFYVSERPYLSGVEFAGSRLLSPANIEKLLADKESFPPLGAPADEVRLQRAANLIKEALAEMGHPQAHITIERQKAAGATLRVRYHVSDGPHLPAGQIEFQGHPEVPARVLRGEMHRTQPGLFAAWRGKGAFTPQGFAEDRANLLIYYQNHGYPEARVGDVQTSLYEKHARWRIPWASGKPGQRLRVSVPIEAGPRYRVVALSVSSELIQLTGKRSTKLLAFSQTQSGRIYSVESTEALRHAWVAAAEPKHPTRSEFLPPTIEASRILDTDAHTVRIRIAPIDSSAYIVRRITFSGQHRFGDRYLRRRIGLQEGRPFDERALELGLARLARTGYFRKIRKEDVHVEPNDSSHTVDVTIHISEAGQQRASLSGGPGQFGSTLGLAYSLFDLLQREELLSTQLDAGPQSMQMLLRLAIDGVLGSRSSLALSVFNDFLRPRFTSSVKGPFYTSESEGLNTGWTYALTPTDSASVNYGLAHTDTGYSFSLPPSLTGLSASDLKAKATSSAIGLAFMHDATDNRFTIANSVSGGALGGTENVLRSNEQYARILPDTFFGHQNAWAFREAFSAAGSYQGELPFYARFLSSDSQVRGLSPGQLGPYAVIPTTSSNGTPGYTALPTGTDLISAANVEYRVPLGNRMQAATFFDLGSGWLLPNWLGPTKPVLLGATNGVLHGSFGLELRWTIPEVQVPVSAYVAVNVLRLNRFLPLPDGSLFRAHNKLFSLGWALGNLF
jgi:outer membrane protein assembly complex protein YaeT